MLTFQQQLIKRLFDLVLAIVVLPFVLLPMGLFFIVASFSTGKKGLFMQQRIGKGGRPFTMYKLRTLKGSNHFDSKAIKKSESPFGSWLRKTKLDELPQIFNVLIGDMSWVGPRPDVAGYADRLEGNDRIILSVRPGITGPATIKYKNEDAVLVEQTNPNLYNDTVIWPDKVAINKDYVKNWSLKGDMKYIIGSVFGSYEKEVSSEQ